MTKVIEIPPPRGPLAAICHDNDRFKVVVSGRRLGKTGQAIRWLLKRALICPNTEWENWYIAPTIKAGKRIAWKRMKRLTRPLWLKTPNESERTITLINGNTMQIHGADEADSGIGSAIFSAVFDEYGKMKPEAYDYNRPAFATTNGQAVFIGTPRGHNHFRELYLNALARADGYEEYKAYPIYKTIDSPWVPESEVEQARKTMDPLMFRQEYEGSFENYRGLVYQDFISDFAPSGNFLNCEYNPNLPLYCGLDFGYAHDCVAIWLQYDNLADTWYVLPNAFVRSQIAPETFAKVLLGQTLTLTGQRYVPPFPPEAVKGITYIAGHEANIKRQEAGGSSMKSILLGLGLTNMTVKSHRLFPSISSVRRFVMAADGVRRLYVNPKGNQKLITDFQAYHYPERDGVLTGEEPVKDGIHDNTMDALRYAICAVCKPREVFYDEQLH